MNTVADPWPRPHRINVDEYYLMAEVGLLRADERVELIEGEVIDMAPIGILHAGIMTYLTRFLGRAIEDRAFLNVQLPVRLGNRSEPQPDIALLKPRADFYRKSHPTAADVYLLIEVSDTTLNFDLGRKSVLYAKHGISELWIIDVAGKQLHCKREPMGESYQHTTILQVSQSISILAFPEITIQVAALFD